MNNILQWNIRGAVLGPSPFLVAGIVNVTTDSFFDGGQHASCESAIAHGLELARLGADMLDIGGESTRPGAEMVGLEAELERVIPVVEGLAGSCAVSVDTYKAEVARQSLDAGAQIINDISAARFDPEMVDVVGQYKPGYVLMHTQGKPGTMQNDPRYEDIVDELKAFFVERMEALVSAGLPEDRILLDPGIGFGKTLEHNLSIFRRIKEFSVLGRPIYMGLSNKSWAHALLGLGKDERANATQVATAILFERGVLVHRVHDVATTAQTLRIARAFCEE